MANPTLLQEPPRKNIVSLDSRVRGNDASNPFAFLAAFGYKRTVIAEDQKMEGVAATYDNKVISKEPIGLSKEKLRKTGISFLLLIALSFMSTNGFASKNSDVDTDPDYESLPKLALFECSKRNEQPNFPLMNPPLMPMQIRNSHRQLQRLFIV